MTLEQAIAHLGGRIGGTTEHVRECVKDALPHYLWVISDLDSRRRRYVICEQCESQRAEVKTGRRWTNTYKQGEVMACPYCGGDVIVKHTGRGYQRLYDRVNVVFYKKSAVDPNAVIAIAAHCVRDFQYAEESPWQLEPEISWRSFTVIVPGDGAYRFKRDVTHWALWGGDHAIWKPDVITWIPVKRFKGLTFGTTSGNIFQDANDLRTVVLDETLKSAIAGTTLERGWSDAYLDDDMDGSVALGLIAKHPCVEYMTKLGMTQIVKAKAAGELDANLINWRGKSMAKVLKLDKGRLGELKHAGIALTPVLLGLYHWMDKQGYRLTANAAHNVAVVADRWTNREVGAAVQTTLSFLDAGRRQRALKYIARQCEKNGDTRLHLGDFRDYWRLCEHFGENMNEDAVAFPSNIREAEARMRERARREDQERREAADGRTKKKQDKMIGDQYKRLLREYGFSFGGLTLRPARDGDEVRAEGKALHHCVAGYVNSYAEGRTVICVLRRDVEPDRPWRTVEISTAGKLVQDRGYHNDTTLGTPLTEAYRAMLNLFWEAWRERKQTKERSRVA